MPQAHPSHRNTIPLSSDRMQQGGNKSPPSSGMPQGYSNKIHLPYKTCTDLSSAKKAVQFLAHWPDPVSEAKSLSWPSPPGTAHPWARVKHFSSSHIKAVSSFPPNNHSTPVLQQNAALPRDACLQIQSSGSSWCALWVLAFPRFSALTGYAPAPIHPMR